VTADVRVVAARRGDLVRTARAVVAAASEAVGWLRVSVTFGDTAHAEGVLWSLAADVEVLAPAELRATMAVRAAALSARYGATAGPR
jgi:predicted DNA-binding transcriptional regulator YafY